LLDAVAWDVMLTLAGERRVAVALIVQPFVTGLLGFALFPALQYIGGPNAGRPADAFDAAISLGLGVGVVGFLMTIFGAFPALMWLLRRGPVSRRQTLVCGTLLGSVPGLLFAAVGAMVFGALIGVTSAAVFWRLAGHYIGVETRTSAG
jgi:hypothetical protein